MKSEFFWLCLALFHKCGHTKTGERPYDCNYCTRKFIDLSSQKRHEKVHVIRGHEIKSNKLEMMHFCRYCKQDIGTIEALRIHEKSHKKEKFATATENNHDENMNQIVDHVEKPRQNSSTLSFSLH